MVNTDYFVAAGRAALTEASINASKYAGHSKDCRTPRTGNSILSLSFLL